MYVPQAGAFATPVQMPDTAVRDPDSCHYNHRMDRLGFIIDISPELSCGIAVFPGDTPLAREVLMDTERGDPITLSTLRSTVHVGSHADAPSHYARGGQTIDQVALARYIGPCAVVGVAERVRRVSGGLRVGVNDLIGKKARGIDAITQPRVLIKTMTQPDKREFGADFAGIEPALIGALADRGVTTIGVDTPSVDVAASKDLPAHAAFHRHDVVIIEGLVLDHVEPGEYELIALPLKLTGFDASPVRAVLRSLHV